MTAIATWNVTSINGVDYLVIDTAQFRVPLDWDPSSNMFLAVGVPAGGFGNFPALVKGDPGDTPTLDTVVNLTVLDHTDPTADSASLTALGGDEYQVNLTLHQGAPGAAGTSTLDPTAYGTAVTGRLLVVNATADGFVYQSQPCGDRFIPSSINSTPSGNPTYTLCAVSVPAQAFDWRPDVKAQTIVTGTGSNVSVDLIARLNTETSGNIVGRSFGTSQGTTPHNLHLVDGPPAGSADSYDRVSAGSSAVIYLRAERQSGTDTFTTSSSTTSCKVKVDPVPYTGVGD